MALDPYRQKRDFTRTPEPADGPARPLEKQDAAPAALQFVVHMHSATRMHYDLRLELDGVLKCWAVPKGPSLDPSVKRLAVATEDHPLAYLSFEGVIPKGQYGGGPMLVWDRGLWFPEGDPHFGLNKGHLAFRLEGEKVRGRWDLVRSNGRADDKNRGQEQWILIKHKDREAIPERVPLVEARPESVRTGRTIDAVSKDGVDATLRDVVLAGDASAIPGAVAGDAPAWVEPMLATAVDTAPGGNQWLGEVKLDGYRLMASRRGGQVRLTTRSGLDWTDKFQDIAREMTALPGGDVLLDGEVVVLDAHGRSDFGALQDAVGRPGSGMVYVAFDLLHLDGFDLRGAELLARKEALRLLLARHHAAGESQVIRYGDHIRGHAAEMFRECAALGLEGIVAKRVDGRYVAGRSSSWVKLKSRARQELVIVGFSETEANVSGRSGIGALLTAVHEPDGFRYTGKVGTGFDAALLRKLAERLRPMERATPPVKNPPDEKGLHWVEPELVAEVAMAGWSRENLVRQASLVGLRMDKSAVLVEREQPAQAVAVPAAPKARAVTRVAGVRLTHPDKVVFPDLGVTKQELAEYHVAIAPYMIPHLAMRPLSLVRCPNGVRAEVFFQKHAHKGVPSAVPRIMVHDDKEPYLGVDSVESLVSLVHFGGVEFHVRGVRADDLDHPDLLVMDLDPSPDVPWTRVARTALAMKEQFEALGLVPFLRGTGGKGLHVVVPLQRGPSWADIKGLTHGLARAYAARDPRKFTAMLSKDKRGGKIFIDYLRNTEGATAVAAWSTRARDGAYVAVPLEWDQLDVKDGPPRRNIRDVMKLLGSGDFRDPWASMATSARPLSRQALDAVAALNAY